jgi:hypothetical protein
LEKKCPVCASLLPNELETSELTNWRLPEFPPGGIWNGRPNGRGIGGSFEVPD